MMYRHWNGRRNMMTLEHRDGHCRYHYHCRHFSIQVSCALTSALNCDEMNGMSGDCVDRHWMSVWMEISRECWGRECGWDLI